MESLAAIFRIQATSKQLLPHAPEFFDPAGINRRQLGFELPAQSLRERWTLPGGGNRDLQIAPAHDGWIVKVAAIRVIDHVAENLPTPSLAVDGIVDLD
jgi:hypothetical protein